MLASLIGFLGDFDLAEEAAQEAFAVAAERWRHDGIPANPGAWLVVTARNRAIDRIRREFKRDLHGGFCSRPDTTGPKPRLFDGKTLKKKID